MTLTKKINYKNHKTRRHRGGMMNALFKGMFNKGGPRPPPPPSISADNVRLFNALGLGWNIGPDSTDYEIFNIAPDADDTAISRGCRTIVNAIRPFAEPASSERREYLRLRILLREKRDKLLDPALRQEYDDLLRLYPKASIPVPPPPVPPLVAQGTIVTFSDTQVPNPILKQPGAVPPSILQTDVGQKLVGFIDHVKQTLRNKGRAATEDDIRIGMNAINMTEKILDYPESSNLENYILLTAFFENAAISPLILALQQTLQNKKGRFDREEPYDVAQNFQSQTVPNEDGKIGPRRFLSLMVLSSRMCLKYKLRSNPECELFLRLNELFQGGNGPNFNSASISGIIDNFIKTNPVVTSDYVKRLVDGDRIYEIYRGNYFESDREISKQLITARLDKWLKIVPTKDFVVDVPVSYFFNKYTNKEKAKLNKDSAICKTVAEFTEKIGKPSTMYPLLPPSAFNIEQNENIDFDKINEYLYRISPPAVKKRADKANKKSLKKKSKLIGH